MTDGPEELRGFMAEFNSSLGNLDGGEAAAGDQYGQQDIKDTPNSSTILEETTATEVTNCKGYIGAVASGYVPSQEEKGKGRALGIGVEKAPDMQEADQPSPLSFPSTVPEQQYYTQLGLPAPPIKTRPSDPNKDSLTAALRYRMGNLEDSLSKTLEENHNLKIQLAKVDSKTATSDLEHSLSKAHAENRDLRAQLNKQAVVFARRLESSHRAVQVWKDEFQRVRETVPERSEAKNEVEAEATTAKLEDAALTGRLGAVEQERDVLELENRSYRAHMEELKEEEEANEVTEMAAGVESMEGTLEEMAAQKVALEPQIGELLYERQALETFRDWDGYVECGDQTLGEDEGGDDDGEEWYSACED